MKKYTMSELAAEWGVSVNTAWKRVNKEGLITVKELVNSREITVVEVTQSILQKYTTGSINNPVNNTNEVVHEGSYIPDEPPEPPNSMQHVLEMQKEFSSTLLTLNNNYSEQMQGYNERVINAELQVRLLEDSEKRKEDDYLRQIAELKAENQGLKEELENLKKPWYKRKKR